MKIIRFIGIDNQSYFGKVDSWQDESAKVIQGNIFEDYFVSAETMSVKKLLPPITPPNILALGLNYKKHADETNISYPQIPVLFVKTTNTIIGPYDAIVLPTAGPNEVDFEAELAIIIKKEAKNIPADHAFDYILGYTCANDISARDWQIRKQKSQWCRGKSFDTFCPIGPAIITHDEIGNPNHLTIETTINGKIFQQSNTSDMIFSVQEIIYHLSQSMTLYPGTLILTGTPQGVGFTRTPPVFLKPKDQVSVFIEKIGTLSNPVIHEV